ncbi:SCO0607 family lipoprotein [Streptomyces sp. NPDC086787]|uniref:SCO0607 family lipoprotein n=1 Tax=Streptomyces sp. NPDC086787 TaxID=3365759 RepID=UPI003812E435
MRKTTNVLVLACAVAALSLTGCSTQDAICGDGEYPAMTVGATGTTCVADGHQPPKGYTRYPEGKVPEHVDDKWDKYWQSHTVDKDGKIIKAP